VALAKKTKNKNKKRQWQTGYSPRPPTSPCRSLHAGWPPVCSSIFQVLLKSVQWFCRCGWSKIALPHYFGHWLIQQLVLPYALCVYLLQWLTVATIFMAQAINYSATLNNMKLVHWLLMGGLLHSVQRGGDWAVWAGPQLAHVMIDDYLILYNLL